MKEISELLRKFRLKSKNIKLFESAFTHSSFNKDVQTKHQDYERLEFLGDSVLGCVVAELAYKLHPDMNQGGLTKLKSALVSSKALANFAREYHFEDYIRVGHSYINDISKANSLLEDVFEAFVGALYIDQGYRKVHKFLNKTFYKDIQKLTIDDLGDYKSRLQEAIQAESRESLKYQIVLMTGPAHKRHFVANVLFDNIVLGVGEGDTKKGAEQNAAKDALSKKVVI